MNDEQTGSQTPASQAKRSVSPEIIVAAVLALVLLIFVVQNDEHVPVKWVVFSKRGPVWVVILVSAVVGYLIGQLIEFGVKRRLRNRNRG